MTGVRRAPRGGGLAGFFANLFGGGTVRTALFAPETVAWQGASGSDVPVRRAPTVDVHRFTASNSRQPAGNDARELAEADMRSDAKHELRRSARPAYAPSRVGGPGSVFTPTQPKAGRRRLVGREAELQRILQALQDDRAHVVLYSERGRGKTSLSNLAVEALRRSGTVVARYTCEAGTDFDAMMRGLMQDLPPSLLTGRTSSASDGCEAALPAGALRPRDVLSLPQRLACRSLVCVVDEFDRVQDAATRTWLADTIKQLSDRDVPLLFLIVGVSENLDQILGQHPSIQRNIAGIHLPLFTDRDVVQVIARGGRDTGLTFSPAAIGRVTLLARGMPYMAQLLGLRLAQAAVARGDTRVLEEDFETAIGRLLDDASPQVCGLYASLTANGQDADMVQALRRIAGAPQDPWGRLTVTPEAGVAGGVLVGGRPVTQSCWDRLRDAAVLKPLLPNSPLHFFAERGLMHHALLLAAGEATQTSARPSGESGPSMQTPGNLRVDDHHVAQNGRLRQPSLSRG